MEKIRFRLNVLKFFQLRDTWRFYLWIGFVVSERFFFVDDSSDGFEDLRD